MTHGSGGWRVSAVGSDQESHHFVERWNVELRHRADLLEPFPHGSGRIEQFESNIMVLSPSLQKDEHTKTAAFYGIHFGEVKHNGSGISLQGNSFAQLERRVALHNSALAFNHRQIPNVIDIDFQHDFLTVVCSVVVRARALPFLCFVQDPWLDFGVRREFPAAIEKKCATGNAVLKWLVAM
jgi:hypothetical protein